MAAIVIKALICLLVIGSAAAGPIMLTWSGTKDCQGNEGCAKVKKDTLIAGIVLTVVLTTSIASVLAMR